jgi:LPS export ABC transporter permease LptF/LPS export ABC transporter permease LptG
MRLLPSRLSRYVFREVVSPTLLGMLVYILVFLMNALFDLAELAIKKDMPVQIVLKLLAYLLPRVLEMTLPMALLLGILIGLGRLSADSELIAIRASGISYRFILVPIMGLAFFCFGLSLVLTLWVDPPARYLQRRLYSQQLYSADVRREIKPRVFFEQVPGLLLYADDVYQEGDFLGRVFMHQTDPQGREVVTLARRSQIHYDRKGGVAEFLLESGTNHTMTPGEPESYQISHFERQKIIRGPDDTFRMKMGILAHPTPRNYAEQNLDELETSKKQGEAIEQDETRRRVIGTVDAEEHGRFSLPFACLTFALIGIPLGIANRRGGKGSGFTLSIATAIAYWLLYIFCQGLVREGKMSPWIGMWGAHAALVLIGLALFQMRERSEGFDLSVLVPRRVASLLRRVRHTGTEENEETTVRPHESARLLWQVTISLIFLAGVLGAVYLTPFFVVGLALLSLILLFSTTIDRHVLKRYLTILAGCVISFFTLFGVYEFIQILDDLVGKGQPMSLAATYLGYRVPWMLSQVLPMSCLMSCVLTYGIMSRFNEVTAIKASGTSIYRLSAPVILATLAVSVLAYVNYDYVVPFSNQQAMQIKDEIRGRSPRSYRVGERRWVFGGGGRLFNFRNYTAPPMPSLAFSDSGTFEGFSVYYLDPATFDMRGRLYAREAQYVAGHWLLKDGWEREFGSDGEVFERFAEKKFEFPEDPGFFVKEWKTPEQMNYTELRRLIGDLTKRGYDAQELMVDLYSKTSFPLVPLTLVVLGLPFCFRLGKHGSLYGIGVAILLAGLYFLAFSASSALGGTGLMPAFLAAWAPSILFISAGTYLLLRTPT